MTNTLTMRPVAHAGSGSDLREWKHVFQYQVEGLPAGEEALIGEFSHRWQILRRVNGVQERWTGDYKTAEEALVALSGIEERRGTIGGGELVDYPGHWKITGRTEGESEKWEVVRKPDGTFWEILCNHIFPPGGGNLRIDIGDQIVNEDLVARLETYYEQLQQKLTER